MTTVFGNRAWIVVAGLLALLGGAAAYMILTAGAGASVRPETTVSVPASFPNEVVPVGITPATFVPTVTREEAIGTVHGLLQQYFALRDMSQYKTSATVGLFHGQIQDPSKAAVSDRKAWVVVVEGLPIFRSNGPSLGGSRARTGPPQFTAVLDADTGQLLYSIVSGKVLR